MTKYSRKEFQKIVEAYNFIFGELSEKSKEYLGLNLNKQKKRFKLKNDSDSLRPYLCSNFNIISNEEYEDFEKWDTSILNIKNSFSNEVDVITSIEEEYNNFGINYGFSLGINPYLDDLLLRQYDILNSNLNEIILFLGHDWYPIYFENEPFIMNPLSKTSLFDKVNRIYGDTLPDNIFSKNLVLFLNLIPDYRKENMIKSDKFLSESSYKYFSKLLYDFLKSINKKYFIKNIITWGKIPLEMLKYFNDDDYENNKIKSISLKSYEDIYDFHLNDLKLQINNHQVQIFPGIHPSAYKHIGKYNKYLNFCKSIS